MHSAFETPPANPDYKPTDPRFTVMDRGPPRYITLPPRPATLPASASARKMEDDDNG